MGTLRGFPNPPAPLRSQQSRLAPHAIVAIVLCALPVPAHGQLCGTPDLLSAIPPDGAMGVATDAPWHAFYAPAALYQAEPIVVDMPDGSQRSVLGDFDPAEGRLSVPPPDPPLPRARYTVTWPELRGTTSGGKGMGRKVTFTTGDLPDEQPPSFAGIAKLAWDWSRETDDCTDKLEDRLVFDVWLSDPSDDGGRDSLTLVLSQTKGPALSAGPRQVYLGPLPAGDTPVRVGFSVDSAVGEICFAALTRDLTGKISNGGDREVCAKTTRPPFFNGCAFVPTGRDHAGVALGMVALFLCLWRRRSHAR